MRIRSVDGSEVKLSIVGYEFPQVVDQYDDSNWLRIDLRVKAAQGDWGASDPALATWEAEELAKWFASIADRPEPREHLEFTEPNIEFVCLGPTDGLIRINAHLRLEFAAPDARNLDDVPETLLELIVPPDELRRAARSLLSEIRDFPVRATADSKR